MNVVKWVREHWAQVISVWVATDQQPQIGPDSNDWTMPRVTTQWQAVVNEILTSALPMPDVASTISIVNSLAPNTSGTDALGRALFRLADVCPILAVRVARIFLNQLCYHQKQKFFNQFLAFPAFAVGDAIEEQLAMANGNRDAFWLRTTVPRLNTVEQNGVTSIERPYRILSKTQDFRKYAFGRWLREIQ